MPTLDWLNRAQAFTTSARVPYRLLEEVSVHTPTTTQGMPATEPAQPQPAQGELLTVRPEPVKESPASPSSAPADITDNLLIQGDNLEALKALLPFYRGQVKCIFIDPPYNTKSAFGDFYDDNLEHAQWLSMMLPRLQLLRELLQEDGSVWVTIDDNEGHYLKVLMDEVFGRENFVANFAWEKDKGRRNDTDISSAFDHVLLFARDRNIWSKTRNLLIRTEAQTSRYKNPDNDPRGPWLQGDNGTAKSGSDALRYEITLPSGRVVVPPSGNFWRFSQASLQLAIAEKRAYFGKNGNGLPIIKRYLTDVQQGVVPRTWWTAEEAGTNQSAKRDHLRKLLPEIEPFATPKPEELLSLILHIATNKNDLVLDSFLGSGTSTAVAHKMGRRWIGIEMGEHAATHCLPRLQKVIDGEQGGISKAVGWQGGGGFRFMKLGAPVFDEKGRIHLDVRFATLAAFIWQQETGTALDASHTWPGTPYLGTHYKVDSCLCPSDKGEELLSFIKTPAFACYLLFNGILKDKRPASGNVLTQAVLDALLALHATTPEPTAPLLVYGEACRLGEERLRQANVSFRHIPYDVKAR